jgi:hypothetical protein
MHKRIIVLAVLFCVLLFVFCFDVLCIRCDGLERQIIRGKLFAGLSRVWMRHVFAAISAPALVMVCPFLPSTQLT